MNPAVIASAVLLRQPHVPALLKRQYIFIAVGSSGCRKQGQDFYLYSRHSRIIKTRRRFSGRIYGRWVFLQNREFQKGHPGKGCKRTIGNNCK